MALKRIVLLSIALNQEGSQNVQLNNISGLKIKFDILKTWTQAYNTAKISVYNAQFSTAQKWGAIGNHVTFSVGYEDEGAPKSVFLGDINRSQHKREETETIWEIEACDGGGKGTDTYVSLSYAAGTTVANVINNLITLSNIPVGRSIPNSISATYPQGWSYAGRIGDALTEALAYIGYQWTISNGQLYFFNLVSIPDISGVQAIQMDAQHGMLYTPEPVLENYQKQGYDTSPPRKWKVKSLIYPQSTVSGMSGEAGTIFQLRSSVKSGFFVAESIHLTGDNFDGDFLQESELRELPKTILPASTVYLAPSGVIPAGAVVRR